MLRTRSGNHNIMESFASRVTDWAAADDVCWAAFAVPVAAAAAAAAAADADDAVVIILSQPA